MESLLHRWLQTSVKVSLILTLIFSVTLLHAQTIQPLISEYTTKADGRFELRNDTATPMAVVLDTRSFSVNSEGRGMYRPLDSEIVLKMSATSMRLAPGESANVFYKATANQLPAWFQIQAVFTPLLRGKGISLRVVLPHTVYLYQKTPVDKKAIQITSPQYKGDANAIECELENRGPGLVRVQDVRAIAGRESSEAAGFPLLPGVTRKFSIEWKSNKHPEWLIFEFPHFVMRQQLTNADR